MSQEIVSVHVAVPVATRTVHAGAFLLQGLQHALHSSTGPLQHHFDTGAAGKKVNVSHIFQYRMRLILSQSHDLFCCEKLPGFLFEYARG
jgi:hypothetical protein